MEAEEGLSLRLDRHRGARTLAARVANRDHDRFVGRSAQLEFFERCLDGELTASVILVHGPGGIGKSTLLREIARRAQARRYEIFSVEGRELPPMPDALEAVLSGARTSERPLVLIDTYERMSALDGYLRRGLLPSLSERAVIVIAGREPPDPGWFTGGWEGVATELALGSLDRDEALSLLASRGLSDDRAGAVVEWAADRRWRSPWPPTPPRRTANGVRPRGRKSPKSCAR